MLDETLKKGLICMNVLDRLKINIEGYTIQRLTKILRNEDEEVKKVLDVFDSIVLNIQFLYQSICISYQLLISVFFVK